MPKKKTAMKTWSFWAVYTGFIDDEVERMLERVADAHAYDRKSDPADKERRLLFHFSDEKAAHVAARCLERVKGVEVEFEGVDYEEMDDQEPWPPSPPAGPVTMNVRPTGGVTTQPSKKPRRATSKRSRK